MNQLNHSASRIFVVIINFLTKESLSGILLFVSAVLAMIIANSSLSEYYFSLLNTPIGIAFGEHTIAMDFKHWVNDFFMALFFLLVGLEIKRELILGELSSMKKASFPIVGAIGGMVIPVFFYLIFNFDENFAGFGVPMATDIAFALGILLLLGNRVPLSLKIFLTSLAVIDDLGAVLVIAFFYTGSIKWIYLLYALGVLLLLYGLNRLGIKILVLYLLGGLVLWALVLLSGVHATIAGVVTAFVIPIRSKISSVHFLNTLDAQLYRFNSQERMRQTLLLTHNQQDSLEVIRGAYEAVQNPLIRLEHYLHSISAFVVMPVFAFTNAGIDLGSVDFEMNNIVIGVMLGLMLGKPVGIISFTYIFAKLKWIEKPSRLSWNHIVSAGILGGIGFTMSIFIANLAFDDSINQAVKIAIFISSLIMSAIGLLYLLKTK